MGERRVVLTGLGAVTPAGVGFDSLWTAVIFHMSLNVFTQKVFAPLTIENDSSAWYVNEFGAVPALVTFVIAIYFWKKGETEFGDLSAWRNTATGCAQEEHKAFSRKPMVIE